MEHLSEILGNLPSQLAKELVQEFNHLARYFIERRWMPTELNGGRFCEVVYTILNGYLIGEFPEKASKPDNFMDSCRRLSVIPKDHARAGDHSVRILIPRVIMMLYEVRNNRGVGHVNGDVNPNEMDAKLVYDSAKWVMAELIRIFHGTTLEAANSIVDTVTERHCELIWVSEQGIRRVLDEKMPAKDQVLVLLYSVPSGATAAQLQKWTEYSGIGMLRRRVLDSLHKERLIEYEAGSTLSVLTIKGIVHVEQRLLKPIQFMELQNAG